MKRLKQLYYSVLLWSISCSVFANEMGTSMPWDEGLKKIQMALTGPTAHFIIIISISISGLTFAFGEQGGTFRRGAGIIFGGSIAIGAATLANTLGISGAVL